MERAAGRATSAMALSNRHKLGDLFSAPLESVRKETPSRFREHRWLIRSIDPPIG